MSKHTLFCTATPTKPKRKKANHTKTEHAKWEFGPKSSKLKKKKRNRHDDLNYRGRSKVKKEHEIEGGRKKI